MCLVFQHCTCFTLLEQNFIPSLIEYLYQRLCGSQFDYDPDRFTDLIIQDEVIYRYPLIQFNFTTYDIQRDQDIIHPAFDKRDIMVYCPGLDGPSMEVCLSAGYLPCKHSDRCQVQVFEGGKSDELPHRWFACEYKQAG